MAKLRELVFTASGSVELRAYTGPNMTRTDWASDADEDFAEFMEADLYTSDDTDAVLEYLEDEGILHADEAVDVIEENASADDDEDDDDDGNG